MSFPLFLKKHTLWLTLFILGVSVFMASYALRVELDASPERLLNKNEQREEAVESHKRYFSAAERELIVLISARTLEEAVQATETTMMALSSFPEVESIKSSTNTSIPLLVNSKIQPATPFGMSSPFEDPKAGLAAAQFSSYSPFFLTEDGLQQAIYISIKQEFTTHEKTRAFLPRLTRVALAEASLSNAKAHVSGNLAIRVSTQESILRDASIIFPLALFAITLVGLMRFRSLLWITILLVCIGNALLWTFGIAGMMGLQLTSLSILFPVVILVSGIADGVHLLEYYAQRRYEGLTKEDSISQMLEVLSPTSFWTTLTTVIGFAAILILPTEALRDFAFLIIVGSIFALINNLILLPLLLNISKAKSPPMQHSMQFLSRIFLWAYRHSTPILFSAFILLLGLLWVGNKVQIDHFPLKTLAQNHQTSIGNRLVSEQMGGVLPLDILIQSNEGDFFDADNLIALDDITQSIQNQGWPSVSFTSLLRDIANHGGQDILPTAENVSRPLAQMLDSKSDLLAEANQIALIHTRVPDIGSNSLLKIKAEIEYIAKYHPQVDVQLLGPAITQAESIGGLTRQFLVGMTFTIIICIMLTWLALRDWKAPLISLLPNLIPIAAGIFYFGITQTPIDLFTAALFVMAIGLTIDDTIHLIVCFEDELYHIHDPVAALKRTAQQSGSGVWDSALILFFGFGMLCFSSFPATQTGGVLGLILISSGLLCDVLLVPAGLGFFHKKEH